MKKSLLSFVLVPLFFLASPIAVAAEPPIVTEMTAPLGPWIQNNWWRGWIW